MASSSARTHEYYSSSRPAASPAVKSEAHIDDVDAQMLRQDVRQDVLIQRSSRDSRQPGLSSATHHHLSSNPAVVIPPYQNTFTYTHGQDVPTILSDPSRPSLNSTTFNQHVRSYPEQFPLSSSTPHHAPLNPPTDRPRTQLPVFGTTSELAAHYGIPRKLPPTPNVNNPSSKPPVPAFNVTDLPSTINERELASFQNQLATYLSMMASKSQEPSEVPSSSMAPPVHVIPDAPTVTENVAHSSTMDMLAGTFRSSTPPDMTQTCVSPRRKVSTPGLGWDEFLTSPFDDSPAGDFDFLETPANAASSLGDDFFTSPLVADLNSFDPSFTDLPVFADDEFAKMTMMPPPPPPSSSSLDVPNLDNLFTMSPLTPALDALVTPAQVDDNSSFPEPPASTTGTKSSLKLNKKGPTGTRKNITPESLVPLEAPTQSRNYITPSTTSRKELPAVFAKKRARSTAFGDEEDELEDGEEAAPPTGTEADAIAAKRRQNTLAARRSRKRKLEYQRDLENAVETERQEKEMWRGKAMFFERHMQAMGYPVPYYENP
ncbi:hypothetical protein SCHPADRAFT_620528 [Schizopora paradoxa]|uniref:BZIP domain-containing protein n=1 Tax=Schizopora paradoxa TaxID=27342 RepID=A0A0H2R8I5_9AGAM|nr:hypothetical protein SCHPADRAFT_620528 [Schizopora paradoxa]